MPGTCCLRPSVGPEAPFAQASSGRRHESATPRERAWVEAANGYAVPPDLTLFVHVSPAVAAQRRAARGGAKELFEEDALQRRIARQYEEAIRRREAQEKIVRIDGEWFVRDSGSVNGTYLNGDKLEARALLRPGDRITIGDNEIVIVTHEGPAVSAVLMPSDPR